MHIDYLVKMANDIGHYFAVYPDTAEAEREIASHIERFWTPVMRSTLWAHVEQGKSGLDPLVERAVRLLHEKASANA